MSLEELRDEDDEAIAGLEPHGAEGTINQLAAGADALPAAAVQARARATVLDPVSERGVEIVTLDAEQGTLELKLGPNGLGRRGAARR